MIKCIFTDKKTTNEQPSQRQNKNMHIEKILQKMLTKVMHQKRLQTLVLFVSSLFHTKILNLTNLGRASSIDIQERSGIRKIDRFLGNKGLQKERLSIYQSTVDLIVGTKKSPQIIVDWSPAPNSTDQILRAALVATGRALTLFEEVHSQKNYTKRSVHNKFLNQLKQLLPDDCKPIIVTDAGFHNPWFDKVVALGWEYEGRIRGEKYYQLGGGEWDKIKTLHKQANKTPKYIGEVKLCKQGTIQTHLYIVKNLPRKRKALTKTGKVREDSTSKKHSKAAEEPWILVTSLPKKFNSEKKVVKIYKTRMQIEEGFRDAKSTKFGFGFEHARTKSRERLAVFLLIIMLASLIACLTGWCLEKLNQQFQYQANSIKNKRVLSLFFLGCRAIKRRHEINLSELFISSNCLLDYSDE